MAVNEENAVGGRVVTAPTNGAAGVVPAVIRYYRDIVSAPITTASATSCSRRQRSAASSRQAPRFPAPRLVARARSAPRPPWPRRASARRSLGLTPKSRTPPRSRWSITSALFCDPIRGLVQVPCIERNGLGAIKAVAAASLALRSDGRHVVPLDNCIETMHQTGRDMSAKYKETSTDRLAVNLPEC